MSNSKRQNYSEPHGPHASGELNRLRAAVLGANDGIISIAGLVVGVAGATSSTSILFATGIAGILSGALSMAAGEYVSVSSQRDTEKALLEKESNELKKYPKEELEELTVLYQDKGLSRETSETVAKELTNHDAFAAHIDIELGINPNNLVSPWQAAFASAIFFVVGAVIPFIAILLPPENLKVGVAFGSVILALILTGVLSAKAGGASSTRATIRVVSGGVLAMVITYAIGKLFSVTIF